ncbi:MAG: hypothetical protein Q9210_003659 [Variospora velana]
MGSPTLLTFLAACALVGIDRTSGQDVLNTGATLFVNGILYYLPGKSFSSGHGGIYATCASGSTTSGLGLVPITVVNSSFVASDLAALETIVDTFSKQDDVWGEAFLSGEGLSRCTVAAPALHRGSASKPLAGVRTGIKDIFNIVGLQTSNGNRAFEKLYPPRNSTAFPVQRLIDAGAILVGKMKTSQFANGEIATADWVDYHEPLNPCGDGYQDTSSSSSGPGSGIGSYPWLDLTLGSDTGGSIRGPSQVQGVYGNRLTRGLVPLTNTMPLAPELDTAGFLVCDPNIWTTAARVMYEDALTFFPQFPPKLQTINFPLLGEVASDSTQAEANTILLDFLAKIEAFLYLRASPVNYTLLWDQNKPDPALPPLSVLLNRTYPTLVSKEQIKNARWAFGDSLPASELDVVVANKTLFRNFWEAYVLPAGNNNTAYCSDSLILYTSGVNIPYRNTYRE